MTSIPIQAADPAEVIAQLRFSLDTTNRYVTALEAEVAFLRDLDDPAKIAECNEYARWTKAFTAPSPAREINMLAREYLATKARLGRALIACRAALQHITQILDVGLHDGGSPAVVIALDDALAGAEPGKVENVCGAHLDPDAT